MFITVGSTLRLCEVVTLCGSIGKHATQMEQGERYYLEGDERIGRESG